MARGNEENTPSKAQNGGTQESRKRKRVVEQGMGDDDVGNKLTSRQLALKQKVESKEAVEALYPPTAVKQLSEDEKLKKSQQAEKRKRLKEEQMEVQKDAILRKIANAVNARSDAGAEQKKKPKKRATRGDIRYVNSKSGSTLSFALHNPVPSYLTLEGTPLPSPKQPVMCITGCGNVHKYCDSKSKQPLCSLKCYRIHQQQHQPTPPQNNTHPSLSQNSSTSHQTSHTNEQKTPVFLPSSQKSPKPSTFLAQNGQQLPSPGLETFA